MIDLKFDVQKIRFDKQKYQISTRADRPKCELKIDFSGAANRVRTSNIAIAYQISRHVSRVGPDSCTSRGNPKEADNSQHGELELHQSLRAQSLAIRV